MNLPLSYFVTNSQKENFQLSGGVDSSREKDKLAVDFVVALYDSDLSYLVQFLKPNIRLFIYNKGKFTRNLLDRQLKGFPFIYHSLPNLGRNDHSYLEHIVRYYNQMSPVTFFFTDSVRQIDIKWESFQSVYFNLDKVDKNNPFLCGHYRKTNPKFALNGYTRRSYPVLCRELELQNNNNQYQACIKMHRSKEYSSLVKADIRPLDKWVENYLPNIKLKQEFCALGVFAVFVDKVKGHPVGLYYRLKLLLEKGDNVETGHYLERLWASILS